MFKTIRIDSVGSSFSADVYSPASTAPSGVIVVAYGTDGLRNTENGPWETMIRGYAETLSQNGLVVVIPDYFLATGTTPGLIAAAEIFEKRDRWQQVIQNTIDFVKHRMPIVDPDKVGLLGFSLGGHLCLRLRSEANAVVEYFAPLFPQLGGIGIRSASGSSLVVEIHHGEADHGPGTTFTENALEIAKQLKSEHTPTQLFSYPGAGHGFVGNDAANANARADSMSETVTFFVANLK